MSNHFDQAPTSVDMNRSKFSIKWGESGTFDVGDIYPHFVMDVNPGDSINLNCTSVIRLTTPKSPAMDVLKVEQIYFYCRYRLLWKHWNEFWGENKVSHWTDPVEWILPELFIASKGTDGSYMAISIDDTTHTNKGSFAHTPLKALGYENHMIIDKTSPSYVRYNFLKVEAYKLIWNDFWRDQNLQDPLFMFYEVENGAEICVSDDNRLPVIAEGTLQYLKATKLRDFATTALPSPQKGPAVNVPIQIADGLLSPVYALSHYDGTTNTGPLLTPRVPYNPNGQPSNYEGEMYMTNPSGNTSRYPLTYDGTPTFGTAGETGSIGYSSSDTPAANHNTSTVSPTNLWGVTSNMSASGFSINELRFAFQLQKNV